MIIYEDKIILLQAESETNRICLMFVVVNLFVAMILFSKVWGIFWCSVHYYQNITTAHYLVLWLRKLLIIPLISSFDFKMEVTTQKKSTILKVFCVVHVWINKPREKDEFRFQYMQREQNRVKKHSANPSIFLVLPLSNVLLFFLQAWWHQLENPEIWQSKECWRARAAGVLPLNHITMSHLVWNTWNIAFWNTNMRHTTHQQNSSC